MHSIPELCKRVRAQKPLIHCITNPISINQCANAILAVGARPIMAEHPAEVAQITRTCGALMLNLGNITDVRMQSMRLSAKAAAERGIPILLDAVGVACSELRRAYARSLLQEITPSVIKGNYSEIHALYQTHYCASGVDADAALDVQTVDRTAAALARRYGAVILASGAVDVVTDGARLVHVKNGTPKLSVITGTGCMLGALTAAYLSAQPDLDAAVTGCVVLGVCGQLAAQERGSGSFQVHLMDALSTLSEAQIVQSMDLEETGIEKF